MRKDDEQYPQYLFPVAEPSILYTVDDGPDPENGAANSYNETKHDEHYQKKSP